MSRVLYPSLTVAIGLRFDDALHFIRSQSKTPSTEVARRRSPLSIFDQAQASLDAIPSVEPLFVSSGNSDSLSWLVNMVPRTANLTKPGFRDAGTFRIELGYHEMPVDPRVVKASQVRIFAGCIPKEDFARGVTEVIPLANGRVVRRSIIQGIGEDGRSDTNLLALWGSVDNVGVSLNENPVFRLTGRDLRGIFLSSPLRRGVIKQLDYTQPIDKVVRQILSTHPLAGQWTIEVKASDWPGGKVAVPGDLGDLSEVHKGASGKDKSGPPPALQESKLNYWQLICQVCFLVGAVPYFVGVNLVIRPAQSLYDLRNLDPFDPDAQKPFLRSRVGVRGLPSAVRQIIYGHNVSDIQFDRKLQGPDRPKVIEVVAVDSSAPKRQDRIIRVYWPEDLTAQLKKLHKTKESPSGQLAEDEVLRVPVSGVRSRDQLKDIAKAIWETTARYEVEGSFETKDLASYTREDGNEDADLLRLQVGDPVEISVAVGQLGQRRQGDSPAVSDLNTLAGLSFDDAVEQVKNEIGDENFARAIVATNRGLVLETETTFRVSEVTIDWNRDSGAKVSAKFHNYIEARYRPLDSPDNPSANSRTTVPQSRPSVLDKNGSILD